MKPTAQNVSKILGQKFTKAHYVGKIFTAGFKCRSIGGGREGTYVDFLSSYSRRNDDILEQYKGVLEPNFEVTTHNDEDRVGWLEVTAKAGAQS